MRTAYQIYCKDIEKTIPLSKDEEHKHFIAWKEHKRESSRTAIYVANLKFVVKVAHKYKNQGVDILDLINEGNIGLSMAMDRFEYNRGLKFITYAIWYIRQAMLEFLAKQSRFVSITGAEAGFKVDLNKAGIKLMQKFSREPTEEELSAETGFAIDRIRHMNKMLSNNANMSLDTPVGDGGNATLKDTIKDDKFDSPETSNNMTEAIVTFIDQAKLNNREKTVLKAFYGIEGGRGNLQAIAFDYNLSRERMRQIKEKALTALRAFNRESKAFGYKNALLDVL